MRNVVLFDALYAGGTSFLDWDRGGTDARPRTLISLATGGRTWEATQSLVRDARRSTTALMVDAWPSTLPDTVARRVIGARVSVPHHDVPARYLAETLRALGLPSR